MADDISPNVVAILLVLVITVSMIGTWTFLTAYQPVRTTSLAAPNHGEVSLSVYTTPEPSVQQANVQLRIAEES